MIVGFTLKVIRFIDRFDFQYCRIRNADLVWIGAMANGIHLVYLGFLDVQIKCFRVYPTANELVGLISVMCHNKKIVFEKYRQ